MRADGDGATALGAGALAGQRADSASRAERRLADVPLADGGADRHGDGGRTGDGLASQVDDEAVLGEMAADRRGWLDLDHRGDLGVVQALQQFASAVGRIAVDHLLPGGLGLGLGSGVLAVQQVTQQPLGDLGIPAVARGDLGCGDELGIRVDSEVGLTCGAPAGQLGDLCVCLAPPQQLTRQPTAGVNGGLVGPSREGPEPSAGRCRRRRAGAAWRGRSEGHLTWPPPPVRTCRR